MDHVIDLHHQIQHGVLPDLCKYQNRMGKEDVCDVIMAKNRHGDTSFHIAARHGHEVILRTLHMKYGVGLNHVNSDGKTALHESAQNGHIGCVDYLIKAGCDVDCLKRADWTPLMLACSKSNLQVVTALIENGASLTLRNKDGWTPFHIASREGNVDILKYLLEKCPLCWKTCSNNQRTPLHTISLHGHSDALKLFLNNCVDFDINIKDSCGVSPLMDSIRGNHLLVTKLLLQHGADLYVKDALGRCAIHHGCQSGSLEVLNYLMPLGIDVNMASDINLLTPLHYAAKENQIDVIKLLLKFGADPNVTDIHGRTALDIAKNSTNTTNKSVELLLQFV